MTDNAHRTRQGERILRELREFRVFRKWHGKWHEYAQPIEAYWGAIAVQAKFGISRGVCLTENEAEAEYAAQRLDGSGERTYYKREL